MLVLMPLGPTVYYGFKIVYAACGLVVNMWYVDDPLSTCSGVDPCSSPPSSCLKEGGRVQSISTSTVIKPNFGYALEMCHVY